MPIRPLLVPAALLVSLVATPASADALQDQVLAAAKATRRDAYAFKRTITFDRTGVPRRVIVEQYDPRRAASSGWVLAAVDGHAPAPKDLAEQAKRKHGKPASYGEIAEWFGAPATRSDPGPGAVLYRFARLPAGTLKLGSHDASPDTRAEALVNTRGKVPFVERVRFVSTKGFSMMLVASLKSMVVEGRYRQLPDGQAVPAETASTIAGSMLGKAGEMRSNMVYSDVQAVR